MNLKKIPRAPTILIFTAAIYLAGHSLFMIYYPPFLNLAYPNFGFAFYISHNVIGLLYGLLMGLDQLWSNLRQRGKWQLDFVRLFLLLVSAAVLTMAYVSFLKATPLLPFIRPQLDINYPVFFMSAVLGYFLPGFLRKRESAQSTDQRSDTFFYRILPALLTAFLFAVMGALLVGLCLYMNASLNLNARYLFLSAFGLYTDSVLHMNIYPDLFQRVGAALGLLMGLDCLAQKWHRKGRWRADAGRLCVVGAIAVFLCGFYLMRDWPGGIGIAYYNNDLNRYLLLMVLGYHLVNVLDRTGQKTAI